MCSLQVCNEKKKPRRERGCARTYVSKKNGTGMLPKKMCFTQS